jgi:preprotein translocase subunit SecG
MRYLLITLHVLVSGIMIGVVLLQKGKGADIGAAFGGASNTVFGPRGSQSVMAKLTTGAAVIFMLTSFTLSVISSRRHSIMESVPQPPAQSAPAAPAAPPASAPAAPAQK